MLLFNKLNSVYVNIFYKSSIKVYKYNNKVKMSWSKLE